MDEIYYGEVRNKAITLVTKNQVYEMKNSSLADLITTIDNDNFVRCHKSFAINIGLIREINRVDKRNWNISLNHKINCPLSKTYYDRVTNQYKKSVHLRQNKDI